MARFDAMLRSQPPDGYAACCAALAAFDARGALTGVRLPTLTIAGAEDPVTPPAKLAAIRDEISGAQGHLVPGARHMANAEQPAAFSAALTAFLDEGEGMRVRRAVLGDAHVDRARRGDHRLHRRLPVPHHPLRLGRDLDPPGPRPPDALLRSRSPRWSRSATRTSWPCTSAPRCATASRPTRSRRSCSSRPIYCGVPAANSAFAVARRVIDEES